MTRETVIQWYPTNSKHHGVTGKEQFVALEESHNQVYTAENALHVTAHEDKEATSVPGTIE